MGGVPVGAPLWGYDPYWQGVPEPAEHTPDLLPKRSKGGRAASHGGKAQGKGQPKRRSKGPAPEKFEESQEIHNNHSGDKEATQSEFPTSKQESDLLLEQLEQGGAPQSGAIAQIRGSVVVLSLDQRGCRVVQLALTHALLKDKAELALELQGNVKTACKSPYGNFVVQKCIEQLPIFMQTFILKELEANVSEFAQHGFACRTLLRLLEQAAKEPGTATLINKLLRDVRRLLRHKYGHLVIKHILQYGKVDVQDCVADALVPNAIDHATDKRASFLVDMALAHCDAHSDARNSLVNKLLQRPKDIIELVQDPFGFHVVSQLVLLPGDVSTRAIENLQKGLSQVKPWTSSHHGGRLVKLLLKNHVDKHQQLFGMVGRQYPCGQQAHQFQHPMLTMDVAQMPSAAPLQPPDAFMPHCATAGMMPELDVQTFEVQQQMQMVSPMSGQHLAPMPQMAPAPTSAMSSVSGIPTDSDRRMALAAQLQDAADRQFYED